MDTESMISELSGATFILWVYRYSEGWSAEPFMSHEDLVKRLNGGVDGRFLVTRKPCQLEVK